MRKIPEDSAIAALRSDWRLWKQFIAECRRSGVIELALDYCLSGFGDRIVAGRFTAFELLEPEARAWLGYFRKIGAIASAQQPDHSVAAQKTESDDCKVWSEAVNDYVLL